MGIEITFLYYFSLINLTEDNHHNYEEEKTNNNEYATH
jgi:hypothetical protein